jgi:hypothetical protein
MKRFFLARQEKTRTKKRRDETRQKKEEGSHARKKNRFSPEKSLEEEKGEERKEAFASVRTSLPPSFPTPLILGFHFCSGNKMKMSGKRRHWTKNVYHEFRVVN